MHISKIAFVFRCLVSSIVSIEAKPFKLNIISCAVTDGERDGVGVKALLEYTRFMRSPSPSEFEWSVSKSCQKLEIVHY